MKYNKPLHRRIFEHRSIYIMLLPAIVWYAVFCYYPMYGVTLAFKDFKYNLGIIGSPWVGIKYFDQFLHTREFWNIMGNTLKISGLKLLCGFPAPILLALLLNELSHVTYKKVIQTLSYLPHFVSWVVVFALLTFVFTPYGGIVNSIRRDMGLEAIFYMGEKRYFYPMVVLSDIWKGAGWGTIIYLAAITNVNVELYEAVMCDGAGKLRSAWHITLPSILPTIGIMFILATGGLLNANMDQILLMQKPPNYDISEILDTYVLKVGIREGRFAYASAIGLFRSAIAFLLVFTTNYIIKKITDISVW